MMKRWSWFTVAILLVTGAFSVGAQAQEEAGGESGLDLSLRTKAVAMPFITADGSQLQSPASHVELLDYTTGTVLAARAADSLMYPSSMTKMMTLYLIFDKLKQGTLSLDSQFTVSEKAWRMQGSKMFVPLGSQIALSDLIRGIAIASGNDACIVVAEGIAGSEEAFAAQMNEMGKKLGMANTHFVDASGWPNPAHTTTPHDLALLAAALIRDFPEYYPYLSEREFTFHNIRQFNRNLLLGNTALHVDGLKTGHTEAAGYGITLSAVDPDTQRRLILVLNGVDSAELRASEGERLLQWGLRNFDNRVLFKPGQEITKAAIWMGTALDTPLTVANDVVISIPKIGRDKIKITASYNGPLIAPVAAGTEVGTLTIALANGSSKSVPLVTAQPVDKLGLFARFLRRLGL